MNRYTIAYTDGKTETVDAEAYKGYAECYTFGPEDIPLVEVRADQVRSIRTSPLTDEQQEHEADLEALVRVTRVLEWTRRFLEERKWPDGDDGEAERDKALRSIQGLSAWRSIDGQMVVTGWVGEYIRSRRPK